ncbi:MAG: CoA transferase [Chloroflexi bacterium]|nr:CoA transferase [Chloroflexota bacterium]
MDQNDQSGQSVGAGPLSGYRVLDFGWVLAGALPGMVLADMGAEVLKVETHQRMDYMRLGRPIVGDEPDPEQHPLFHNVNRGKLSITLNTTKPQAIDLIKELVAHCDVVIENFSPGVMDRLGLGYEVISGIKPEIVMASISSNGQTGPLRDLRAYAPSIGALAGLDSTMGYEGERPLGLKHAYADIAGALHSVFAIVSALHQKERTGRGQYIDVSMLRATVATMGAGLMEYEMTGRVMAPKGNYDPVMSPYGNYPCQGDDAWVSIAVRTEEEWQGLKEAMGNPAWCEKEQFASRYSRLENRRMLDDDLAAWTRERTAGDITELLQARGVAAIPVMGAEDRLFNPHFRERGLYADIVHPSLGAEPIYNIMWNLDRTPPSIRRHAPLMGEHNRRIFGGLLGMDEKEIARLEEDQVLW